MTKRDLPLQNLYKKTFVCYLADNEICRSDYFRMPKAILF